MSMLRAPVDYILQEAIPLARLVLCGGIVGASCAGLLFGTIAADTIGALIGASTVVSMKLAHIL